mmetsp:Transcript_70032/g.216562  ORF Transcript_70032/g.216562 Transcript_70032/m.216562 type:complete len:249 (+) Transcript_70032:244-990(+)
MRSSGSWPPRLGLCETSKTRTRRMPRTSVVSAPRSWLYSSCKYRRLARAPSSAEGASRTRLWPSSRVCSATNRCNFWGSAAILLRLALRTRRVCPRCHRSSGKPVISLPEISISSSLATADSDGSLPPSRLAWTLGCAWKLDMVVERSSLSKETSFPRLSGNMPTRPLSESSSAMTCPCSSQVTPYHESQHGSVSRDQLSLARQAAPCVAVYRSMSAVFSSARCASSCQALAPPMAYWHPYGSSASCV